MKALSINSEKERVLNKIREAARYGEQWIYETTLLESTITMLREKDFKVELQRDYFTISWK